MHRAINIKHRIVRRVDISKAPLATFDTIDLGDEDVPAVSTEHQNLPSSVESNKAVLSPLIVIRPRVFLAHGSLKSETIGGNNSKKSLSQAGGEDKESKDAERTKQKQPGGSEVEHVGGDTNQSRGAPADPQSSDSKKAGSKPLEGPSEKSDTAVNETEENAVKEEQNATVVPTLCRQGTIGRVSIPIKKQDSDSSSSSSGSCKDNTFTFNAKRPSVGHLEGTSADGANQDGTEDKECQDSLLPDNIDPSQILSPSKRKAYERRIERLKVTTSPIARPRSTTPISVVTLDEYAAISSPEPSPASPCVAQDKLRITLPSDEFTAKPKTPKPQSVKRRDSEDSCFEFTEEILFSRTKSALVVDEDGQHPVSPRRVLIPPTLTPTSSPKLSAAPRLSAGAVHEETATGAPKLVFIQHNETAHKFFGDTVDETEEENWAHFPDVSVDDDDQTVGLDANIICDKGGSDEQSSDWPSSVSDTDTPPNVQLPTESLPNEPVETEEESCTSSEHQTLSHFVREPDISSHFDQAEGVSQVHVDHLNFDTLTDNSQVSEGLSIDYYIPPTNPVELPDLVVGPDFELEEEILTVEISEGGDGCEKHIEIEIKSSGSSGNISPADTEPQLKFGKLAPENLSSIPKASSDSALVSHVETEQDNLSAPPTGISKTKSETISLSLWAEHPVPPVAEICHTHDDTAPQVNSTSAFLHKQQPEVVAPVVSQFHDPTIPQQADVAGANIFDSRLIPQQTQDFHQHPDLVSQLGPSEPELGSQSLSLDFPPPFAASTNPFVSGFQPPDSDPFDLGLQQVNTNPFLSGPSQVSSDLIDFSSSFDKSSTS